MTNDPYIDLYCYACGYNLRGLSGKRIRCPECGVNNSGRFGQAVLRFDSGKDKNSSSGSMCLLQWCTAKSDATTCVTTKALPSSERKTHNMMVAAQFVIVSDRRDIHR